MKLHQFICSKNHAANSWFHEEQEKESQQRMIGQKRNPKKGICQKKKKGLAAKSNDQRPSFGPPTISRI